MKKGMLIVVEGSCDGIGKTTQFNLLCERLKKEGHDVLGITMKLFDDPKEEKMLLNAKVVCEEVGIPHIIIDLKEEFKRIVIDNFIESYKHGLTPNPCVLCNKYLKFGLLYEKACDIIDNFDECFTSSFCCWKKNCCF